MLKCTHIVCGHTWNQVLFADRTDVNRCLVCLEEEEEAEAIRRESMRQDDRGKAQYYQEKYGDQL